MNQCKIFLSAIFVFGVIMASSPASFGQPDARLQVEPSYEVSLQLVIGTNDTVKRTDFPNSLSAISRQLKSSFTFSNYRLAGTFLGRLTNSGSFEYKSLTNIFGQESTAASQTFLDWSVGNLRNGPNAKGAQAFQAQSFHFGARVPVTTGSFKDESGKMNSVINYEAIGVSVGKLGLPENVPTLIGTLNLPGANDTIFLVMTVRSADM